MFRRSCNSKPNRKTRIRAQPASTQRNASRERAVAFLPASSASRGLRLARDGVDRVAPLRLAAKEDSPRRDPHAGPQQTEQNPDVHYLLYHDRNPRLHHCSQFYHVPICETDASMACAASNRIGVVSAMDAHALFIKCNPYHPHRVVWSGRQQVEFELRFPSSSILRS